ncbi:hypothetical protein CesoFtcFv8_019756 [Champsocephalus esox]|uniref:VWFD domain-containing protein n=1 Tax=Champsocephalus esox TaxID=159716 RepID=A0AAN8BDW8_9TELE|nr:hypothetical protein CesoFtcFv8_019756 [Champsocephalus esox]
MFTCSENGTMLHEKHSCGLFETCVLTNNVGSCHPVGNGTCQISADPHYNTFTNHTFNFQGTYTYTAARSCHLEGSRLKAFSVVVEHEKWTMTETPNVAVAKRVAVKVYDTTLVLRMNQLRKIMVNGTLLTIPLNLNDEGPLPRGLSLCYYALELPDGKITEDLQTFGSAWKVAVQGVVCEDGCSGDKCPKCDATEKDCESQILPFAACHRQIHPESYYRDCVYDVCMSQGRKYVLCNSISAYVTDCQTIGVKIDNWRTPDFCPITCPANSHYQICSETCGSPCPGLTDTSAVPPLVLKAAPVMKDTTSMGQAALPWTNVVVTTMDVPTR